MFGLLSNYADCWLEVRSRIFSAILLWFVVFLACFYFRYDLLTWCQYLISAHRSTVPSIVALSVVDGFYVTFELSFYMSLLLSLPAFVWQLWCFLSPALFYAERWYLAVVCFIGLFLFFLGLTLGWLFVLPVILAYAHWFLPTGVVWLLGLRQYVSLFWYVGIYCGLFMELPLMVFFLVHSQLVSPDQFHRLRPYVLLGCFVIGMFATPPDMFAQIFFALPMYALFELGFCCSQLCRWLGGAAIQREIVVVQD